MRRPGAIIARSARCHPELGALCRAKDLSVLRDAPPKRNNRAFSTLPNCSSYVVNLPPDPPATTLYFYDSYLNRVNVPNLHKYIRDYALDTRLIVLYYSKYGYRFGLHFFSGFVWPFTCLFTAFTISGLKRCFSASSSVISIACFFFLGMVTYG
jgi:hypothetical protein